MCWHAKGIDENLNYAKYSSDWLDAKQKSAKEKLTLAQMKQFQSFQNDVGVQMQAGRGRDMNVNVNPNIALLNKTTTCHLSGQTRHWKWECKLKPNSVGNCPTFQHAQ